MAITKLENGNYNLNGKIIEAAEAYDLFHFMNREYHIEDITYKLEALVEDDRISEELSENEKFIEAAVFNYERNINNDDGWNYLADAAIFDAIKEFEKDNKNKNTPERV